MKASHDSKKFTCIFEVATLRAGGYDAVGESIIRVSTTSGQGIMSLSISREIGLLLTNALGRAEPTIDLCGNVGITLDDEIQFTDIAATISLDQLVANAGTSDMLADEPEAAQHLSEFRARLLKSLEHVDRAIASLPKD